MRPTGITADRHRAVLAITWNDGHCTNFPFVELSAACPCANCNDEREKLRAQGLDPRKDFKPKSSLLQAIEPVGSYAVNIVWQNGCRFGIYTWDLLLDLERQHPEWSVQE
ncbi:MAG: DUF971 domain-containing protein [Chloroflexi bacterium]|nr:DUF971 domain-containing protein [Chloroflexota bacterium]